MIVAIEKSLYRVPSKEHGVLPHLVARVVFPLAVSILSIEIVFLRWSKGRLGNMLVEVIPFVILEPDMIFNFLGTIQSQSVDRLSLDELVDEVSRFKRPPLGHFILTNLNLL